MTIKEVAQLTGLSHQAIYKKIKGRGWRLDELKDKATGQFTPDAEQKIMELFDINSDSQPVDNQVEKLTKENEKLRNQVDNQEAQIKLLTDECAMLRDLLDKSQQLQAMTLAKLPSPPPALPAGKEHRLRNWLQRMRGGRKDGE